MSKFKNKEHPPPKLFCRKGAIRNFAKFTGKHLCQCLFLNKVAALRSATLLKRGSVTGVFLWILQNFEENHFLQNNFSGCFWKILIWYFWSFGIYFLIEFFINLLQWQDALDILAYFRCFENTKTDRFLFLIHGNNR